MEGVEGVVGYHYVIHEGEVEAVAGFAQLASMHDVGTAGMWISGWVIMDDRHGEGSAVDGALNHSAHIKGGRVPGT